MDDHEDDQAQPNWVRERFKEISGDYGHQAGFVLVAELLALILDYLETSDQEAVKQISGLVSQQNKKKTAVAPPVNLEIPLVVEQTGPGSFRFTAAELQSRFDQL